MQGQRYGKHGFSHDQQADVGTIDVGTIDQRIDQLLAQGLATQKGDIVTLDASALGVEKVLGSGKVTRKLNITAKAFSEQAKTKIEGAGGQVLTT
jgi:large subunit ribosomal protein L15